MEPNEITAQIVDAAFQIHSQRGPGLLETVDEVTRAHELRKRGLRVRRQVPVPIEYDGLKFDEGFRMDLLAEEAIIVEIKSVEKNILSTRNNCAPIWCWPSCNSDWF